MPHLSQDTFASDSSIGGVYIGLEDFIERQDPPLYQFKPPDGSSPLRRFIALPEKTICVLGARRMPPLPAPAANPNTNTTISVSTALGFRPLLADDYAEAAENLQADVIVGLGDIPYGRALGSKRVLKAMDRSIEWIQRHARLRDSDTASHAKLFAPLLPVSCASQQFYVDSLIEDRVARQVSGLVVYSLESLQDLPEELAHLPRLAFTSPATPHDILRQIALGIDVFTIPFVSAATDSGIALSFTFPSPSGGDEKEKPLTNGGTSCHLSLGVDMWSPSHATDLSPLTEGCTCYACTSHHRAYIQHLLNAKEMLGWVLLQIHNHHNIDLFFAAIRESIKHGRFDGDMEVFGKLYEKLLPKKTGLGPRLRGYQRKSRQAGEAKQNLPAWKVFEGGEEDVVEKKPLSEAMDGLQLELQGLATREQGQ